MKHIIYSILVFGIKHYRRAVTALVNFEKSIVTKSKVKALAKRYDELYYVPCQRTISNMPVHHFRLYGERLGKATLLWQSFGNHNEDRVWEDFGAEFRHESPYVSLDNY